MTKIGIQNPKLIVTNDYQKFWAHFDWFLSLFQISDVKPELLPVELKVSKNGNFWAKNLFQKIVPRLFLFPNQSYVKKLGQNSLLTGFYRGGQNLPPPATWDAFQRLPLVGLRHMIGQLSPITSSYL